MTHNAATSAARMSEAARSKRKRARQRGGEMIVPVPITYDDTDALIDAGLLGAWDERNREAIANAIRKLLAVTRGALPESDLLDPAESHRRFRRKANDRPAKTNSASHS